MSEPAKQLRERFEHLFEPELIDAIVHSTTLKRIPENTCILEVGDLIRSIPFVLSGVVKVSRIEEDGRELLLYYISPDESCAMTFTCCMQEHLSEIRATTEEESTILLIPISVMDEWLSRYPTWKSFVMKTIRHRFNELLRTIDMIAFQNLDDRLIHYLREKSKATSSTLINLSHEQIANELATSRVVISRLLKVLEQQEKLLLYRNQIKLLSSFFV